MLKQYFYTAYQPLEVNCWSIGGKQLIYLLLLDTELVHLINELIANTKTLEQIKLIENTNLAL
jgi:hypothetical protein